MYGPITSIAVVMGIKKINLEILGKENFKRTNVLLSGENADIIKSTLCHKIF